MEVKARGYKNPERHLLQQGRLRKCFLHMSELTLTGCTRVCKAVLISCLLLKPLSAQVSWLLHKVYWGTVKVTASEGLWLVSLVCTFTAAPSKIGGTSQTSVHCHFCQKADAKYIWEYFLLRQESCDNSEIKERHDIKQKRKFPEKCPLALCWLLKSWYWKVIGDSL